jgi:hypothetical protein
MEVRAVERGTIANPLVVMVESGHQRPAAKVIEKLPTGPRRFVLVPADQLLDLRKCITLGIDAWLTVPVTPQQVSAALGRLVRQPGLRPRWDPVTCLPVLDPRQLERGALYVTPGPDASPAQSAWLVRTMSGWQRGRLSWCRARQARCWSASASDYSGRCPSVAASRSRSAPPRTTVDSMSQARPFRVLPR